MRLQYLYVILTMLLSGIMPALTSCCQKEIVFPEAGMAVLGVRFEWQQPETDLPQGMTLWFFSLDEDRQVWRFDIADPHGGPVELPYGNYTMISCNNDVAGISISGTSTPASLTATLRATDSIAPAIIPLYRAQAEDISFSPSGTNTIVCHPQKISTTYEIEAVNTSGLERAQKASVTFHGVYADMLLHNAFSSGPTLDITSDGRLEPTDGTITASFGSFAPLRNPDEAYVEVAVTLKDRRIYRKIIFVGDQLANLRNNFYVKIVIEGLSIPDDGESPDNDVGMKVDVDGWNEITTDYITGP